MKLLLPWIALAACSSTDELSITIDSGPIHGAQTADVRHFLGIPYAAPPVGDGRWRAPQPIAPWTDTLMANEVGSQCPQILSFSGPSYDEDCLFVNVWTPAGAHDLPVMVWLHGGAFIFGSGGDKYYAGDTLADQGMVVVTINYRLGAFGFLAHPALTVEDPAYPTSGNYGLEDQRVALQWVQRNIAAFGGDPAHVTLFGESAGGFSTCVHYLSSRTQGLFEAAISESGLCGAPVLELPHAMAEAQGVMLGATLGCSGSDATALACLRGIGVSQLLAATGLPPAANQTPGGPFYQTTILPTALPNVDGYVLAAPMDQELAAGAYEPRPLILGTNKNEGTLFHASIYAKEVADETDYRTALAEPFGASNVDAIVAQYPVASFDSANDAIAEVTGDAFFVCPARREARAIAAAGATVFRYSFERELENPFETGLGVFHSSELPFVFGNDDYPLGRIGDATSLSQTMGDYWTQFAKTSDPNASKSPAWPSYDASDTYQLLDVPISTSTAQKAAQCDFWDTLPPSS